jgi:uncharacterized protein (DUF885 family)
MLLCCRGSKNVSAPTVEPTGSAATTSPPAQSAFGKNVDAILDRWLEEAPAWGRQVGLHRYDGLVARYSAAAIADRIVWLKQTRAALDAADPATLTPDDALDRALLWNKIRLELFNLEERELPRMDPRYYEELFDVSSYVNFDYAPLRERARRLVEHQERALAEVPHIEKNLAPVLSRPVCRTAIKIYKGYAEYLRGDVAKLIDGLADADIRARFAKSNDALAGHAESLAKKLETQWLPKANDTAHVLGRERFLAFVEAQEGRRIELGDFKKMAEDNLAANKSAYEELLRKVTPTRPPADKYLAEATRVMDASRQFIIDKKLFTIPSEDRAVVAESPPYMRWNAAFLNMPGPFDSVQKGYYYITLPDPSWPKKEQEEYIFAYGTLLATTVHEVYPGHFLHGLWTRRAPTRAQKMGDSYSFTEGWAHYTEQMMVEEGFGGEDPQNRLGQLNDALLRNCRFVVSIGVHAEGMSLEQAEKRFIDDCFQDKAGAREQAVRATFDPGYFAYTLGKLQILELREVAKKKLGDKFSLRGFHDALLSHGAPPVAVIRDRVLADLGAK